MIAVVSCVALYCCSTHCVQICQFLQLAVSSFDFCELVRPMAAAIPEGHVQHILEDSCCQTILTRPMPTAQRLTSSIGPTCMMTSFLSTTSSSSSHHALLGRGWFSCQGLLPLWGEGEDTSSWQLQLFLVWCWLQGSNTREVSCRRALLGLCHREIWLPWQGWCTVHWIERRTISGWSEWVWVGLSGKEVNNDASVVCMQLMDAPALFGILWTLLEVSRACCNCLLLTTVWQLFCLMRRCSAFASSLLCGSSAWYVSWCSASLVALCFTACTAACTAACTVWFLVCIELACDARTFAVQVRFCCTCLLHSLCFYGNLWFGCSCTRVVLCCLCWTSWCLQQCWCKHLLWAQHLLCLLTLCAMSRAVHDHEAAWCCVHGFWWWFSGWTARARGSQIDYLLVSLLAVLQVLQLVGSAWVDWAVCWALKSSYWGIFRRTRARLQCFLA